MNYFNVLNCFIIKMLHYFAKQKWKVKVVAILELQAFRSFSLEYSIWSDD